MKTKTKIKLAAFIAFWLGCSAWDYSTLLFDETCRVPQSDSVVFVSILSTMGPLALPASLLSTRFPMRHMWIPLTTEQRWEAFHHKNPLLDRDDFERIWNGKEDCEWSAICKDGEQR